MAKLQQNHESRNISAEIKAKSRLYNGDNIVRLWRFDDFYMVAHWREAEALAKAVGADARRVWSFPLAELENVVPRLVRAGSSVYIF